ncbi:uncharacterized protein T551_03322 [Pneumocystis jirovecii RU7]|uniref:FAM192A/Fyv6 N-terminal domain-containing protein n=1 Tax=Pneumocystis jirovecii (strain RU7) TaxID=1408657 RepID=A0A0W4ZEQ3_PNEJ7|nr:uncharacterized protein T551_03322 [Pneumocystis jirovecii RU7]KTW26860.1 hypothetical protein T551_03322 [Pneumocystis jirovecii RU7]
MGGLERIAPRFTCERSKEWEEAERRIQAAKNPVENGPPVDHRSLYEKLQANKIIKEEEYQESWKLSNLIRTLNDEEIDFLDKLRKEKIKVEEETKKSVEEGLKVFKRAREQLDHSMQQSIHLTRDLPPISKPVESTERPVKKTKESMLKGVILKKNKDTRSEGRSSKPKNLDFKENEDNKHIDVARGSASLIEKNIVVSETSVLSTSSPPSFSELSTNNSDQKLIAYTSDSDEKAG